MSWSWRYTTINTTTMFRWFTSVLIIRRRGGCTSNMYILFTVIIFHRWMKWSLFFSVIFIGGTCFFPWMRIVFWIIISIQMWLEVYEKNNYNNIFFRKRCNTWNKKILLTFTGNYSFILIVDSLVITRWFCSSYLDAIIVKRWSFNSMITFCNIMVHHFAVLIILLVFAHL